VKASDSEAGTLGSMQGEAEPRRGDTKTETWFSRRTWIHHRSTIARFLRASAPRF
jgi:hypothetical protein